MCYMRIEWSVSGTIFINIVIAERKDISLFQNKQRVYTMLFRVVHCCSSDVRNATETIATFIFHVTMGKPKIGMRLPIRCVVYGTIL